MQTGADLPVTISDVWVTLVADTGADAVINGGVTVAGLGAGRTVSLIGLNLTLQGGGPTLQRPVLLLEQNAGSIRVEDCSVQADTSQFYGTQEVARVTACADVAFARTDLMGGNDHPFLRGAPSNSTESEVRVQSSVVVFHGGSILGTTAGVTLDPGFPLPNTGGAGVSLESGSVFLSGTSVTGGMGGSGVAACEFLPGADGGPGGPPGPALDVQAGLALDVPGAARGMTLPSPARELESTALQLSGQPGDLAGVFWGVGTTSFWKASLHGLALIDFGLPTYLIVVGPLPQSGQLSLSLDFDDLGPGWEGIALPFQAAYSAGPGQLFLAAPVMAVILDEAL